MRTVDELLRRYDESSALPRMIVRMMSGATQLAISVIIPTKNRAADLKASVRSVLRQTCLPSELLIVDQSLGNENRQGVAQAYVETAAPARQPVDLNYIQDSAISGLTEARNRAIGVARGDIWLFLDDDVVLEPDFIKELMNVYQRYPHVAGVSGVVTNYTPYSWPFRLWSTVFLRGPFQDPRQAIYWKANRMRWDEPVRVDRFTGALMSFRADVILGLRFDNNLRGVSDGEDVDFCASLGPYAVLMMAPRARLVHNQSPSGREQSHWLRRHARSKHYLYRRNWQRGFRNRGCFIWLNIGYTLAAAFASARRHSAEPWRAMLAGIRDAKAIPR